MHVHYVAPVFTEAVGGTDITVQDREPSPVSAQQSVSTLSHATVWASITENTVSCIQCFFFTFY